MSNFQRKQPSTSLAALYMGIAGVALAAVGLFAKLAQQEVSAYQVAFVQNVVSLALVLPITARQGFSTNRLPLHLLRDIVGTFGVLFFVMALRSTQLATVAVLLNTGPLFVPLISWLALKKKIRPGLWGAIFIGFIGVTLMIRPNANQFDWGLVLALAAGIAMAIVFVTLRLLSKTDSQYLILFYFFLIATIVTSPFALLQWTKASYQSWGYMLLVGLSMFTYQFALILAFQRRTPAVISPLIYLSILWAALFEWFIFEHRLDWLHWAGAVLIIIGGVIALSRERHNMVQ